MQLIKILTGLTMLMMLAGPALAGHVEGRFSSYPYNLDKTAFQAYNAVSEYRGSIGLLNRKMKHVGSKENPEYKEALQNYKEQERKLLALVRESQGDLSSSERNRIERKLVAATDLLGEAYEAILESVP